MTWWPIVDAHADTLARLHEEGRALGERSAKGHSDVPRLIEAGVSLQVLAICTEDKDAETGLREALAMIDRLYLDLSGRDDAFVVCTRADLDRVGPGRVGFLLGLEGAGPLRGRAGLLRVLFRLGLRLLGLTWNGRNDFADGVKVEGGGGLTGAGRDLLALAEELGIVVDLAHLNERGFWDAVAAARQPVVVSHANARAVCDHPRNLTDEQLRAVAARGGVVGLNLYPPFLAPVGRAGLDDVLRQLDYLLQVAGRRAVGLGLDFDGIEATPIGLPDITALPRLTAALDRMGLDEDVRAGLLGGNWLRVFRQILP